MVESNILPKMILLLLVVSLATAQGAGVYDVTRHGAKADPMADISQALTTAWKEACASAKASKVLIPPGQYGLGPVSLEGPCKAAVELDVRGTLKALIAPANMKDVGSWVYFNKIDRLTITGGGIFDGQGATGPYECPINEYCKKRPINLSFNAITNGMVQGVTSLNSKQFHVNVIGCKNFTFQQFTITAPEDSRNTDGIHVGRSSGITVKDSKIGTGDDCISIGDGTEQMEIVGVTCGPGHGISIGSLGKYKNEQPVVGIRVRNTTLSNTDNGLRFKTWPALEEGFVSDCHFEDITMNNVSNPIIVDQMYCPWNKCNLKHPSRVKITNITFTNIRGTSSTSVAVKLSCSSGVPCKGVKLADIDLKYTGLEGPIMSECANVQPMTSGKMNPPSCRGASLSQGNAP